MGQSESKPPSGAGARRQSSRRGSSTKSPKLAPVEFVGDFNSTLDGHAGPVLCCAFSPDEKFLITGSVDQAVFVWSLVTGRNVAKLTGHSHAVTGCAFAGPAVFVTASLDCRALVWNFRGNTAQVTYRYSNHEGAVLGCRISNDGQYVATCSEDTTAHVWLVDGHAGAPKSLLRGHTEGVLDCQFSPDDITLATCSKDKTIRLWNRRSGKVITQLKDPLGPQRLRFSFDGIYLCVASIDNNVRIWNTNSEDVVNSLSGHTERVTCCDFNVSGQLMASSSYDNTVRIWNPRDVGGAAKKTLAGHTAEVLTCVFSPSGRYLATGSKDNMAKVWK